MPECTTHKKLFTFEKSSIPDAVAKIKRVFADGQFNIMLTCPRCLSEVRRMSQKYDFEIEVEMFTRRSTDELKERLHHAKR